MFKKIKLVGLCTGLLCGVVQSQVTLNPQSNLDRAIANAENQVGNFGTIYLNPGVYSTNKRILVDKLGVRIVGRGSNRDQTIINYTGNKDFEPLAVVAANNIQFQNLTLHRRTDNGPCVRLINSVSGVQFKNVVIADGTAGINPNNATKIAGLRMDQCRFTSQKLYGFWLLSTNSQPMPSKSGRFGIDRSFFVSNGSDGRPINCINLDFGNETGSSKNSPIDMENSFIYRTTLEAPRRHSIALARLKNFYLGNWGSRSSFENKIFGGSAAENYQQAVHIEDRSSDIYVVNNTIRNNYATSASDRNTNRLAIHIFGVPRKSNFLVKNVRIVNNLLSCSGKDVIRANEVDGIRIVGNTFQNPRPRNYDIQFYGTRRNTLIHSNNPGLRLDKVRR